jgi:hypothetical protein
MFYAALDAKRDDKASNVVPLFGDRENDDD